MLVNAPDTSKYHSTSSASVAMKLMVTPVRRTREFLATIVKPVFLEEILGERLRRLAFTGRARLEAALEVEFAGRFGHWPLVTRGRFGHAFVAHAYPGDVDVRGIEVVADVAPPEARRGDERRPRAHERVEHEVVLVRVETDQTLG